MKTLIPAALAALLMAGTASAQSINIGPGGVSVDPRSPQERAIDRDIRREERARERDRYERRAERARWERDRRDCRVIVEHEETRRGTVRRETRVCD